MKKLLTDISIFNAIIEGGYRRTGKAKEILVWTEFDSGKRNVGNLEWMKVL
ncbi:MAG: hypothetical protein N3C60_01030 [Calditerrivibrio sp.]|nr:hypothetical protein [Calditerrivibrio sp.]